MTTRLSTKGQLIIPKEIRERHRWAAGVELDVVDHGDYVVVREADDVPRISLDELVGCADYHGPARTIEEMDAAIAEGARRSR
jgi:AbrB family looped-hinge helix DNA binding protein